MHHFTMNLTISALRASNKLSLSPYISTSMNLKIRNSMFSHHISSVFHVKNNFAAYNTQFRHSLNTSIVLDSVVRSNTLFTSRETLGQDVDYQIISCAFYKCSSSSGSGAISCPNIKASATFKIQSTGFDSCKGEKGGAFAFDVATFTLEKVCFRSCSATASGSAFKVTTTDKFTATNILVDSCSGQQAVYCKSSGNAEFKSGNLTHNNDGDALTTYHGKEILTQYMTYNSNTVGIVCDINTEAPNPDPGQFFNFILNTGKSSIYISHEYIFIGISFINERTSYALKKSNDGLHCNFRDLITSASRIDKEDFYKGVTLELNPTTDSTKTQSLNLADLNECWVLISNPSTSTGLSWKIKALIIVAIVAVVLVSVFIYRKTCGNKFGLSGQRLAYTL